MTRMTLTLDDAIINEAKELLHTRTKRETIESALKEVIKQKKRENALKHCGKVELELTQEELQAYREKE